MILRSAVRRFQERGSDGIVDALENRGIWPIAALLDHLWMDWSWWLPGPANQRVLRVFAQRRSGHHAILNWIRYQYPGRHCLLNECEPGKNPFEACSRGNSRVKGFWGEHRYLCWAQEQRGNHSKKGTLIHNYEDCDFTSSVLRAEPKRDVQWLGTSREQRDILILRDPFNLFASKLRWARGQHLVPSLDNFRDMPVLWKIYAREFLDQTGLLQNKVCISYNQWFCDRNYRDELARILGFENRDAGLSEVAKWGPNTWGDSFDGLRYDGQAQQMEVLERWQQYETDELFRSLFRDEELIELSRQIFGEIKGTEVLYHP